MTLAPTLVRPAAAGDLLAVTALARALATASEVTDDAASAILGTLVEDPRALLAVAEDDAGVVVGYVLAHRHLAFHADGWVVWVEEVVVDADARRRGTGRALLDWVEAWAAEHGATHVALASRRAGPFYVALGYEDSAVYYKKPQR